MTSRYDASKTIEGQFQPDSNNRVLANKLGITDPQKMDNVELALLEQLTFAIVDELTENQQLMVADICEWHRRWLGNVYVWAGSLRSVNMDKERGFNNIRILRQGFCLYSRRRNRRIAGYATVSTTRKTDKKTSQDLDIIKSSLLRMVFNLLRQHRFHGY